MRQKINPHVDPAKLERVVDHYNLYIVSPHCFVGEDMRIAHMGYGLAKLKTPYFIGGIVIENSTTDEIGCFYFC